MLVLRFLLSLVDESVKIRQLADFLFGNILKGHLFPAPQTLVCVIMHWLRKRHLRNVTLILRHLTAKAPLLAYNSFVEVVFVLNDCHAHMGNKKSQNSKVENRMFSIR